MPGDLELSFILDKTLTVYIELKNSGEKSLPFPAKEIVSGKKEEEKNGLFFYVEEYLRFKGPVFSEKLFKQYQVASDTLDELSLVNTLEPLNTQVFYSILNMIDMEEMHLFLSRIISIPKGLEEKFVQDVNGTLNAIQTYTKKEYAELITLSTALKLVMPVLGKYMDSKSSLINKNLKEILFLPIFSNYPRFKRMDAFKKLELFAEKAYIKEQSAESDAVRSILVGIPKDETVKWLFASSLFLGLMSVSTINDNDETNIIKKIFKSILSSRINKRTDNTKIKNKANTTGGSAGEETQESNSEACRVVTDITPGAVEELNWSCETPAFIMQQMHKNFTFIPDVANQAYRLMISHSKESLIIVPDSTFVLLGWIFQLPLNHYESFKYLKMKELYSAISVAYAHLYANGFKDIGLMILSKVNNQDDDEDEVAAFNNSGPRAKIPEMLKQELEKYYNIKKNKVSGKNIEEISIPELGIHMLSDMMYKEEFLTLAPSEHILAVKGASSSPIIIANGDLKIRLAEMLLFINKRDTNIDN